MASSNAEAQGGTSIRRVAVFFACNGVNMDRWFPNGGYGQLTDAHLLGTANEPLLAHRSKLLIPRGVHMSPRGYGRDGGGGDDHGRGMAQKLTAQFADETNWLALGPSIDHVLAAKINPGPDGARRPPLNLMVGKPAGYKGLDYISYRGAGDAVAAVNNPWNAYAEFMNLGGPKPSGSAAENLVSIRRKSVLDVVSQQFSELKNGPLSAADKNKLDAHFTKIRELEQQMTETVKSCGTDALSERARAYQLSGAASERRPKAEQENEYPAVADLQIDILALALACDFTRVATLQFDRGSGGPTFKWDGMAHEFNHHKLSHGKVRDDCFGEGTEDGCANVPGFENMLFEVDRWHQQKFARLLDNLDSYGEAEGKSVLDNSVIMYTNELSDGKAHSYMQLPYILAGSCGGVFKQDEYLLLGEEGRSGDSLAPHNKLLNTIVNAMGVESTWFGVAEGAGGKTMQSGVFEQLLA